MLLHLQTRYILYFYTSRFFSCEPMMSCVPVYDHSLKHAVLGVQSVVQLLNNFLPLNVNPKVRFFIRSPHRSLSEARWAQFTLLYHIFLRFILILFRHLRVDIPPSLHTNVLFAFPLMICEDIEAMKTRYAKPQCSHL
jgi:hypothetical protein